MGWGCHVLPDGAGWAGTLQHVISRFVDRQYWLADEVDRRPWRFGAAPGTLDPPGITCWPAWQPLAGCPRRSHSGPPLGHAASREPTGSWSTSRATAMAARSPKWPTSCGHHGVQRMADGSTTTWGNGHGAGKTRYQGRQMSNNFRSVHPLLRATRMRKSDWTWSSSA
jgi:hypothetical protein